MDPGGDENRRDAKSFGALQIGAQAVADGDDPVERHRRAAHLFGAAETLRESVGASVLAFYRADYDRAIATVRAAIGQRAFESCWSEGRTLAPEEAVAYALGESSLSTE